MVLSTKLFGKTYVFRNIKAALAKANEEKTGDQLAGLAAESAQERVAAKVVVANLLLSDLRENPAVPYEQDEVTRIIQDDLNEPEYRKIRGWTVSELREYILAEETTGDDLRRLSRGLTAEMVAAVTKLMSNLDLIYAAQKIRVTAHCNTTIGLPGTLSCRLQPNHTTDDPEGILASTLEGSRILRSGLRKCWSASKKSKSGGASPPKLVFWPMSPPRWRHCSRVRLPI